MLRSPAVVRSPSDQQGKKAYRLNLFFLILSQFPLAFQADFSQRFPSLRNGHTPILIPPPLMSGYKRDILFKISPVTVISRGQMINEEINGRY